MQLCSDKYEKLCSKLRDHPILEILDENKSAHCLKVRCPGTTYFTSASVTFSPENYGGAEVALFRDRKLVRIEALDYDNVRGFYTINDVIDELYRLVTITDDVIREQMIKFSDDCEATC
jgi:hypothetical protein